MFHSDSTFGTERLGALSDGVFSIILTLLVLDLKLPALPADFAESAMILALEERIPNLVAWLISFVLVARIWIVHHSIISNLGRCHVATFAWNFVVLCVCSLVPFGAGLIGTYDHDPLAIALFSSIFGLTGLSLGLLARHAAFETHLHHERTKPSRLMRHWRYHAAVLPVIALLSIVFASRAGVFALAVWLIEPALAFTSSRRFDMAASEV